MTCSELDAFRNTLTALIRRVGAERHDLRHTAMQSVGGERGTAVVDAPANTVDPGTAAGDEFLALSLLPTEEHILAECHAALQRIEQGVYGTCERCHRPIARERLKAVPYARQCVPCVRELEAED
jgi:DnaK suppressor protein